eukprot:scaffold92491_cov58-Phaeocystis_antarctica.AAC.1
MWRVGCGRASPGSASPGFEPCVAYVRRLRLEAGQQVLPRRGRPPQPRGHDVLGALVVLGGDLLRRLEAGLDRGAGVGRGGGPARLLVHGDDDLDAGHRHVGWDVCVSVTGRSDRGDGVPWSALQAAGSTGVPSSPVQQRLGVLLSCHPRSRTPPSGLVGRWPLLRTF